MDVKASIADILKNEGVEYVFGYTGGHIMQMWEAANNAGIKLILNKQEGNGAYMADGYTRASGKIGVVLGTVGPGATNMLTALANAYLDSIPLLAIGANVSTTAFGRNAVQEGSGRGRATEQKIAFKAVCKQAMLAPAPQAVPDMVRDALRTALSGRPGPVYIEIPSDFWDTTIDYHRQLPHQYKNTHLPLCDPNDCDKIYKLISRSKHPLIIVGEGAVEPTQNKHVMKYIDQVKIPFGVSPLGKNAVDEFHPLYLGALRQEGKTQKIYEYLKQSDLLILLGDRLQEWEVSWYDNSLFGHIDIAQIDPDHNEIGRVYPATLSAVGSVSSFTTNYHQGTHTHAKTLSQHANSLWKKYPHLSKLQDGNGINPLNLNNIVQDNTSSTTTIVCDTGYAKSMAIMKYRTKLNQIFIASDKNGPMGYSVPAALGAALATKKEVVCFVGDGGFQMSLNELGTALNYNLKVIYIIENNSGCASIVDYHTETYGHHCADTFKNPNYAKLAEAYNMQGFEVKTTSEFKQAFKKAQTVKSSVLIDAHIDQSKMVWE